MTHSHPYEGNEVREKKPTVLKGLVFLLLLIAIGAGLFYAATRLRSAEGPKVAHDAPAPLTVAVVTVERTDAFDLKESYTGLAEARRTSMLGFASSGRIAEIRADVGDKVKTGALLAKLDTRSLQAQLASARAQVQPRRSCTLECTIQDNSTLWV